MLRRRVLRRLFFLPVSACLTLAVSCSINQSVLIESDGSGTANLHLELSKSLANYFSNLNEIAGKTELVDSGQIFDLVEIRQSLEARPGVSVTRIVTLTPSVLDVDLSYESIKDVFNDNSLKSTGIASFSDADGVKTLKLHLDKDNYKRLGALFPILNDPLFSGMGPQAQPISTADYLKMIEFSLGSDGPAQLTKSTVVLTIRPEGDIVSQSGGSVADGAVTFKLPLLRVLILDQALDYSVSFR